MFRIPRVINLEVTQVMFPRHAREMSHWSHVLEISTWTEFGHIEEVHARPIANHTLEHS